MKDVTQTSSNPIEILEGTVLEYLPEKHEIHFTGEDFLRGVELAVQRYGTVSLETMDYNEVFSARTSLRKFKEGLERKRIDMKKEFLKPYDMFYKKYQEGLGKIEQLDEDITNEINAYKDFQKSLRQDVVRVYVQGVCDEAGLDIAQFDDVLKKYVRKGDFTDDYKLQPKAKKEIDDILIIEINKANQRDQDLKTIDMIAESNGLVGDSYKQFYDQGTPVTELIGMMTQHAQKAKELAQKKEMEARLAEERQKQAEQMAMQQNQAVKVIDEETGEIIEAQPVREPVYQVDLRFYVTESESANLKELLREHGYNYDQI